MMNGKTPFYNKNRDRMYKGIQSGEIKFTPEERFSQSARQIIKSFLLKDDKKRLGSNGGAERIKEMPFFSNIDFNLLVQRKLPAPFVPAGDGLTGTSYVGDNFQKMDAKRDSSARSNEKAAVEEDFSDFTFSEESRKRRF